MTTAGTDADQILEVAEANRRANLTALRAILPTTYNEIQNANAPSTLTRSVGRDGAPSYNWQNSENEKCRLGRVTMPLVSSEALIDAFEPGDGNTLIVGFGHGYDVRALLQRLRPHQAVFAIEPESWTLGPALSLHDFSGAIRKHRLLVFAGQPAWERLEQFLIESPGFLTPDRILAWPWMDKRDIHAVSAKLSALQTTVARDRSATSGPATTSLEFEPRIWINSNSTNGRAHRWARGLESAARESGVSVGCCAFDSPCMVNPLAVKRQFDALNPTVLIFLDSIPQPSIAIDEALHTAVIVTHPSPLADVWLKDVPSTASLFVQTEAQRNQVVAAGIAVSRLAFLPPGADAKLPVQIDEGERDGAYSVVLADRIGASASDVGLHLASHKRLWERASAWITSNVETYGDDDADRAMRHAEASVGIEIQDDEVRAGLTDRIRRFLGPHLVSKSIVRAMVEEGSHFRIAGAGWEADADFAEFAIGADLLDESQSAVALIVPTTNGWFDDRAMNWLSSGRPVLLRQSNVEPASGLQSEIRGGMILFSSLEELLNIKKQLANGNAELASGAKRVADIVRQAHMWRHRLQTVLGQLNQSDS